MPTNSNILPKKSKPVQVRFLLEIIRNCFLALIISICFPFVLWAKSDITLYPGITMEQHRLAQYVLFHFNSMDWDETDASLKKLQQLEKKNSLLPLSNMLFVATRVWRVQNDEFSDASQKKQLLKEINAYANKGIDLLKSKTFPDSVRSTRCFLEGGISGFIATLEIKSRPFSALRNGLNAVRLLDTAVSLDPHLYDAYLGTGLFNCALAKSPGIVKGAVNLLVGRKIDLDTGLNHLRICAEKSVYTKLSAKLYLIEFLSPYQSDQESEKQVIFKSIQHAFPGNPYYVFLELDEDLCFFPDKFFKPTTCRFIDKRLDNGFYCPSYSSLRYANLVKWQFSLCNSDAPSWALPSPILKDRDFSFYPVFLEALKLKHNKGKQEKNDSDAEKLRDLGTAAVHLLSASDMNPLRKDFYLWHLRDALHIE